jgi:hypothetical protein
MANTETNEMAEPEVNEWTLMFFFAGDNSLSPSMISQLKAIKDAGFQKNTTVIVRFDPNEKGAPTKIFEVNRARKTKGYPTMIGDGRDPFVRNLIEDDVTPKDIKAFKGAAERAGGNGQKNSETIKADEALSSFLDVCQRDHSANHYMLFLIGHGMIVGNDAFLPDDRPDTAITLEQLDTILRKFAGDVKGKGGVFELVGMHSCSMSAIEVAYQLKGTANYMMASEGISFVGSWPYRQLLKKIFNTIEPADENELEENGSMNAVDVNQKPRTGDDVVKELLTKLQKLCLHNSTDFMFTGFSADLTLCDLNPTKVKALTRPLQKLTKALKNGLQDKRGEELILLAHLKSQSYFQETYTDLYDFCFCLSESCKADLQPDKTKEPQASIKAACDKMTEQLEPAWKQQKRSKNEVSPYDALIVYADHFGPTYQYSHGLSIYFPWSRPIEDGLEDVIEKYRKYAFTTDLISESGDHSWLSFLEEYFKKTLRHPREAEDKSREEEDESREPEDGSATKQISLGVEVLASGAFSIGALTGKPSPALPGKTSPADSGGQGCNCGSIKNYTKEFLINQDTEEAFPRERNRQVR